MADDAPIQDIPTPDATSLINGLLKGTRDAFGFGAQAPWIVNMAGQSGLYVFGVIARALTRLATLLATGLQKLIEQDNPELGRLAATILGAMFGRDVADKIPGSVMNPGNLDDNAEAVGAAVLTTVFGPLSLGGGTLTPGVERAESYLGAITNMVTRGFLLDLICETVPEPWRINAVAHLEEELIAGLGLGRIARTVMRPIVTTLVADPALWALNLAYRPKLANEATAVGMWQRGDIGDDELDDVLGRQGWGQDTIAAFKVQHTKHAGLGELTTLYGHKVMADGDVVARLKLQGYDEQSATETWEAAKLHHFESWAVREAEVWLSRYEGGFINASTFESNIRALPLFPGVGDLLIAQAAARLASPRKALSIGELMTCWNNQILTQNQVHDYLVRVGYSEDDATSLLLNELAIGKHKSELADEKKQAQKERALAIAAAKAQRLADQAAAKAAAAVERQAKAVALAQEKAQRLQDAETRREFVAKAAEQKRQLVAAAHAANQITADQASEAQAQIAADLADLQALADAQTAEGDAGFAQQLLDLRQADREALLAQQLADVDLMLEPIASVRSAAVGQRLDNVQTTLAEQLADLDTLYAEKASVTSTNLANAEAAVDVELLPTIDERAAAASSKQEDLDAALTRKLADIAAEWDDKQAAIDAELAAGTMPAKTAQTKTDAVTTGRAQATRAAQQAHDLATAALATSGKAGEALSITTATTAKTKLQTAAAAALTTLAGNKVAAQLAAHQAADKETLNLKTIAAQIAPLTAAEAARRRLQLQEQDDAAKRAEQITAVEIAKSKADADAKVARVHQTAAAAKQRLQAVTAAAGARESATTAQTGAATALAASQEAERQALERTLIAHQTAGLAVASPQ